MSEKKNIEGANNPPEEETGRYLMFYHPDALEHISRISDDVAGIKLTKNIHEAEFAAKSDAWRESDTIVIPSIGVAICTAEPDQIKRLQSTRGRQIREVRKEMIFELATPHNSEYLRGYQDGVTDLIARIQNQQQIEGDFGIADEGSFRDSDKFTWGLQAISQSQSRFTGKDIKVAVLDTGIDFVHPDFAGRDIKSKSFIDGILTAADDNAHGTHCAGTIGGPKSPSSGPRYGVASDVQLFVGKVMNAAGKGREGDILNGIGWAIQNNCRIVSLSISKAVSRDELPIKQYEEIGRIALSKNCMLIAAAGNNSIRPGLIAPVSIPANSSTVMAVGAIDRRLALYNRSNGGEVDLVGPGVDVFSSKPAPLRYGTDTGTSMSAPHVAGVAALMMESDPSATAEQIWTRLIQSARRLPLASTDVGSGLVQVSG